MTAAILTIVGIGLGWIKDKIRDHFRYRWPK